jgi:hypothetical protein
MFDATLILDDASGDDVTYVLNKQDGTGSERMDQASTLAEPSVLRIKHSVTGKGSDAVDRHLVQIAKTEADSTSSATAVVNFTISVPRSSLITSAMVYDLVANLLDFLMAGGLTTLTTTNLAKLLLNES